MLRQRKVVLEDRYIELLNGELRKHDLYQEGMVIVASPEGATGHNISGYSLKGGQNWPKVLADVAYNVNQKYDVKVTD